MPPQTNPKFPESLKYCITGETVRQETDREIENILSITIISKGALQLDSDDRRFFMPDISNE